MKTPAEMTDEELLAAPVAKDPIVREMLMRLSRAGVVVDAVLAADFLGVADRLQKAVMLTTPSKDASPALLEAMSAYHEVRIKVCTLAREKVTA